MPTLKNHSPAAHHPIQSGVFPNRSSSAKLLADAREYVLIEQDRMSVECFRRDEQDRWVLQAYGPGDRVELSSLDFSTTIEMLYEDVTLPAIPDKDWRLPEENEG